MSLQTNRSIDQQTDGRTEFCPVRYIQPKMQDELGIVDSYSDASDEEDNKRGSRNKRSPIGSSGLKEKKVANVNPAAKKNTDQRPQSAHYYSDFCHSSYIKRSFVTYISSHITHHTRISFSLSLSSRSGQKNRM